MHIEKHDMVVVYVCVCGGGGGVMTSFIYIMD